MKYSAYFQKSQAVCGHRHRTIDAAIKCGENNIRLFLRNPLVFVNTLNMDNTELADNIGPWVVKDESGKVVQQGTYEVLKQPKQFPL